MNNQQIKKDKGDKAGGGKFELIHLDIRPGGFIQFDYDSMEIDIRMVERLSNG